MQRRVAAIFASDVVGFSRLMGANEVGTLTALKAHRSEAIDPRIGEHEGRIVKLTGDGMLVEFPSPYSAVTCAATIQKAMRQRNLDVPEDRKMLLRIGINYADIIIEEDNDIFGDGVNIAARIESVAKPGGVSISQAVRDAVGERPELSYRDTGEQKLKNIDRPVRIYDLCIEGEESEDGTGAFCEVGSDRVSIAVLPFANMSGDPEQEYFSDGICEDVIFDLSQISGLFVVGRNTSFTYKGRSVQLQEAAKELGVTHILEGSVRKMGNRVRITAQLVDGATGGNVWAERYDRELDDIFALQDEITKAIVGQLKVRLLPEEKKAIEAAPTENIEAYTYYLRGRQFFRMSTKSFLILARRMFVKATELDPRYARAYTGIANCDSLLNAWHGVAVPLDEILVNADKALAIDPDLAEAYAARGVALAGSERKAEAVAAFETALAFDPNCHEANYLYAKFNFTSGNLEKAAALFIRALELQPDDYFAPLVLQSVFHSLGRTEEATRYAWLGLKRAEDALRLHPEASDPAQLGAATLAALGEKERAKEWLSRALAIDPDDNNVRYNAACTYALLDDADSAFDLLEPLVPHLGAYLKKWFQSDPDLDGIRRHPRYAGLLELAG